MHDLRLTALYWLVFAETKGGSYLGSYLVTSDANDELQPVKSEKRSATEAGLEDPRRRKH